jgi:hypothetical protein
MFCAVRMNSGTERLLLRTNPGGVEGDPRGKADTCVQVNCPHSPLARFLVPFFRAEKRNCPPHRRKGIVRRGFAASEERLKSSLCRLRRFTVYAYAARQLLFVVPQKVTKKGTKGDRHNALRASACLPWNPHHNTAISAFGVLLAKLMGCQGLPLRGSCQRS